MDIKKIFVAGILTTMASVLVASLHGMAQDVIRMKTHITEIDKRIDENHERAKKIFGELRIIRKDINTNHRVILNELIELHKREK